MTLTQADIAKDALSKDKKKKPPFDFNKIKVVVKRSKDKVPDIIFLDRVWARQEIPHFRPVIDSVKQGEGIEITLTCNLEAFNFIIEYLEAHESNHDWLISERVNAGNCLSVMVTAEFLQLRSIAHRVTKQTFIPNFEDIINTCKLNLPTLNPKLM